MYPEISFMLSKKGTYLDDKAVTNVRIQSSLALGQLLTRGYTTINGKASYGAKTEGRISG
jgi:hypothetical protein